MMLEFLMSLKISIHHGIGKKEDMISYIKSVAESDQSMQMWREED